MGSGAWVYFSLWECESCSWHGPCSSSRVPCPSPVQIQRDDPCWSPVPIEQNPSPPRPCATLRDFPRAPCCRQTAFANCTIPSSTRAGVFRVPITTTVFVGRLFFSKFFRKLYTFPALCIHVVSAHSIPNTVAKLDSIQVPNDNYHYRNAYCAILYYVTLLPSLLPLL